MAASLMPFRHLSGALQGGLKLLYLPMLRSLAGLENITSIAQGTGKREAGVEIVDNDRLYSVLALKHTHVDTTKILVQLCLRLKCVPANWPEEDFNKNLIRRGQCNVRVQNAEVIMKDSAQNAKEDENLAIAAKKRTDKIMKAQELAKLMKEQAAGGSEALGDTHSEEWGKEHFGANCCMGAPAGKCCQKKKQEAHQKKEQEAHGRMRQTYREALNHTWTHHIHNNSTHHIHNNSTPVPTNRPTPTLSPKDIAHIKRLKHLLALQESHLKHKQNVLDADDFSGHKVTNQEENTGRVLDGKSN
jgi:hypothetical protein